MKKIKNQILNNELVIFLIYMFLIKPPCFSLIPFLNKFFNIVAVLLILLICFIYFEQKKISKLQIAIMILIGCLGISTLFGTRDFYSLAKTYSIFFTISLYTEMLILNDYKKLLRPISLLLSSYIIINYLTLYLIPKGFDYPNHLNNYFLGYDNSSVILVNIGLFIMIYASYCLNKKISLMVIITTVIAFLTYYKLWAASCLVSVLLVIFFLIFVYKKDKVKKILNFKFLFIIAVSLFLLIVVFRFQNLFSVLIVNILHKSLTFTGRTKIWNRCVSQIIKHPILGLGVQNPVVRLDLLKIYHAHSTILNVLLEGGILSLLAYFNIFRVSAKDLNVKNSKNNELINICSFAFFVYLISTLVEVIHNSETLYILFNLSFYAQYIYNKQCEEKKNNLIESRNKKHKDILIISGGHLPIPAVMGGAVEALIESYISENDAIYHDNLDVLSVEIPLEYQKKAKKYKYTNFIYIKNQSKNSIYNICCRFLKKINIHVGSYYINKGIRIIKKMNKKYDIILCENEPVYTLLLKQNFDCKIILHLHNDYLHPKKNYYTKVINNCDKIFAVSNYMKERIACPKKCIIVYNGIDFNLFTKKVTNDEKDKIRKKYNIAKNDFVFIFVGRVVHFKGISELIDAFLLLNQKYDNVKLLIIGKPSNNSKSNISFYEKMMSKRNSNIKFVGYVSNDIIYKYYSISNVQVTPTLVNEAFGLTALEALVCKKRVIASKSGALPELINKNCGVVVDKNNLVNNLFKAMEDEYLNKEKNTLNIATLKEFTKEKYGKRMHDNILEALDEDI